MHSSEDPLVGLTVVFEFFVKDSFRFRPMLPMEEDAAVGAPAAAEDL